jgi:hypothetical protein
MNIQNIDITKINIENPQDVNEIYEFKINYDNEPFEFITTDRVILRNIDNDVLTLSVTNKTDLKLLYHIYNSFIHNIFSNQNKWFEGEFDMITLKKSFEEYLTINIEENCANIICGCNCINDINLEVQEIVPLFSIDKLVFRDGNFIIELKLKSYEEYVNQAPKIHESQHSLSQTNPSHVEVEEEKVIDKSEEDENIEDDEDNGENDIQEFDIETSNLEDTKMSINEEDFYLFYKTIQGNIYNNFSERLHSIFREKEIQTNDIDLTEIIWDSDDSDMNDEDTEASENNFEEQVGDLM